MLISKFKGFFSLRLIGSLAFLVLIFTVGSCQVNLPKNFKIRLLETKYNDQIKQAIGSNDFLGSYKYLGGYSIDPKKNGTIDIDLMLDAVEKLFPNEEDAGLLSVNLEGVLYRNLKNNALENKKANESIEKYRLIISKIKEFRPNIQVGIYGFPFTFFYDSQRKYNADDKVKRILELCDYISPSLYSQYPVKEIGIEKNNNFFKENLIYSLKLGAELDKPVIPYVWHIVHPSNKKHGGEVLSVDEMAANIEYIANFKSNGRSAEGVIWWESSDAGLQSYFEQSGQFTSKGLPNPNKNDLIEGYLKGINPQIKSLGKN